MTTVKRCVHIGGPSHGEIVGGNYEVERRKGETVFGPYPVWWVQGEPYIHKYRCTGSVAAGMLVYEYVGTPERPFDDGEPRAANEGKLLEAGITYFVTEDKYRVQIGHMAEDGFEETWYIRSPLDFREEARKRGYKINSERSNGAGWVVYRP